MGEEVVVVEGEDEVVESDDLSRPPGLDPPSHPAPNQKIRVEAAEEGGEHVRVRGRARDVGDAEEIRVRSSSHYCCAGREEEANCEESRMGRRSARLGPTRPLQDLLKPNQLGLRMEEDEKCERTRTHQLPPPCTYVRTC